MTLETEGGSLPLCRVLNFVKDTDIDEPVPPVKSSMPSAPAEEVPASDEER